MSPSCFNDDFNKAMKLELLPLEILIPPDNIPINMPVPGNGGIITTTAVGSTSIQLSWTQATDVETSQPDLEYSLYRSDSNNISTPDDADKNGMVVASWQKDMVTALADSLTSGTTYYFNVVVRDGDGNRTAYLIIAVTTASDAIYMFSAGSFTGALADPKSGPVRDSIDILCGSGAKTAKTYSPPCLNKRAFISISSTDDIASMPTKYGVPTDRKIISLTGIQIANNWSDLLDGTIDKTLSEAGIASDDWWSGSTSSGIYDVSVDNCTGWTALAKKGQSGKFNTAGADWIQGNTPDCNASRLVLCVCW
jgi:hypothetical protein